MRTFGAKLSGAGRLAKESRIPPKVSVAQTVCRVQGLLHRQQRRWLNDNNLNEGTWKQWFQREWPQVFHAARWMPAKNPSFHPMPYLPRCARLVTI